MKPWCEGPVEIIQAAHRIASGSDPGSTRIALILIDNAVEVMAKTFLSLPKRVNGVKIPRKELEGIFESFPAVISCLEKNSGDRLNHIDLGEIEWHHGLRNKLYHDGSGLTVEKVAQNHGLSPVSPGSDGCADRWACGRCAVPMRCFVALRRCTDSPVPRRGQSPRWLSQALGGTGVLGLAITSALLLPPSLGSDVPSVAAHQVEQDNRGQTTVC